VAEWVGEVQTGAQLLPPELVLDASLDGLPANSIPPGCEADLRAVAAAIQRQGN